MKPITSLIVTCSTLLFLSACGGAPVKPVPVTPSSAPSLPVSPCIALSQQSNSEGIFGYGQGKSLAAAKQQAYADISEQLQVTVKSESITRVNKTDVDVQTAFEQQIASSTDASFTNLTLECLDQHSTPGTVHLVMKLDRRSLATKIAENLRAQFEIAPAKIIWKGPAAITQSDLLQRITTQIANKNGSGEREITVNLFRDQQQWMLSLGALQTPLNPEQLQLLVNWQALARGAAQLVALTTSGKFINSEIANETEYRLALKHPKGGYAQLIGVYENGETDLLRTNMPLAANLVNMVPEGSGVFEAARLANQPLTTDTFILLVTNQPLSNHQSAMLQRQSDAHAIQRLIENLEKFDGEIAIVQLVVE